MGGVRVPVLELGVRGGDKWLIYGVGTGIWESVKQLLQRRWNYLEGWIFCFVVQVKVGRQTHSGELD